MGHRYLRLVPISLIILRAALAPALWVISSRGGSHLAFGLCLSAAFLSDVFDGIIARRLGVATPGLRRLDSAVDTLFYLSALYCVWHSHREALLSRAGALATLAALEAVRYGFDWLKFRREASYHMWSSKLWGVALFVAFFLLLALGTDTAATGIAIYLGILADLEGLAISLVLDRWQADVPTLVHAFRRRSEAARARAPVAAG
ncbi:MAG TPA: CDP-alcohol phosphatidyltransferase family protein [Steroidobacteraceae bacterium]|nr:CDP-alcohol phosphatidyltransferase family protein [Steroidobacteraceae bacterium]